MSITSSFSVGLPWTRGRVDPVHVRPALSLRPRPGRGGRPDAMGASALEGPGGGWARTPRTPTSRDRRTAPAVPRYLLVPRMGPWAGVCHGARGGDPVAALPREGQSDVLFAQAVLADRLAAVLLGRRLGVPVACLGRGTTSMASRIASATVRWLARWAIRRCAAVAVVAQARAHARREGARRALYGVASGVDLGCSDPATRETRAAPSTSTRSPLNPIVGCLADGKDSTLLEAFGAADQPFRCVPRWSGWGRSTPGSSAASSGGWLLAAAAGEARTRRSPSGCGRPTSWCSERGRGPNVVREALACGTPVVATPLGDVPAADHRRAVVPPGNSTALAAPSPRPRATPGPRRSAPT